MKSILYLVWSIQVYCYSRVCGLLCPHQVLIPVLHAAHWTLYAFDMCGRELSILDCSSSPHPKERNEKIRLQICSALNQTMGTPSDKSKNDFTCWKFQYPDVPRQQNRCTLFFVFFVYLNFCFFLFINFYFMNN